MVGRSYTFVYLMTNLRCNFIMTVKIPAALKKAMGLTLMTSPKKNGDIYWRIQTAHKIERKI